jgi:multicomponent Na+:H+ antiporter subunit G
MGLECFRQLLMFFFLLAGSLFMLIAALGILRFPDVYMRVSASTKASTLGIGFLLMALALHFAELGITSRAVATIFFILATSPVAGHLISRSAYLAGVPLCPESRVDEWKGENESLGTVFPESGSNS